MYYLVLGGVIRGAKTPHNTIMTVLCLPCSAAENGTVIYAPFTLAEPLSSVQQRSELVRNVLQQPRASPRPRNPGRTPLLTAPNAARAQGLIDFLWGGTDEWGGKRQVVDFDPKYSADQVIVSFGDRRLYLITQKGKAISYPIAVPREQSRWEGTTTVSEKKENPSWRPTPDMLRENPKLPTWVPGGHPMNPLGVRAMYLGASTYRIHGTDAPWTIGQAVSKGCIRMYNEDVLDLYPRVPVGMKVTVTWQQFNSQAIASNDDSSSSASPLSYEPPASWPARRRRDRRVPFATCRRRRRASRLRRA